MIVVCFSTNSTIQYIYCIVGDGDNCTVSSTVTVTTVPSTVTVTTVPSTVTVTTVPSTVTVTTVSSTATVTPRWCIANNSTPLCSPSGFRYSITNPHSENFPYYIGTLVLVFILSCCCIFGWTCCICCSCIHKRTQKNKPIMYTSTSKSYV